MLENNPNHVVYICVIALQKVCVCMSVFVYGHAQTDPLTLWLQLVDCYIIYVELAILYVCPMNIVAIEYIWSNPNSDHNSKVILTLVTILILILTLTLTIAASVNCEQYFLCMCNGASPAIFQSFGWHIISLQGKSGKIKFIRLCYFRLKDYDFILAWFGYFFFVMFYSYKLYSGLFPSLNHVWCVNAFSDHMQQFRIRMVDSI